jgi:hypothetical protein
MFSAKACPICGGILRFEDVPGSFAVGRYLAAEFTFWAAIALIFAFLYSPAGSGGLYLGLAAIAGAAWVMLRPQQRAHAKALLARRQYYCAQCRHRFKGSSLHQNPSH